ncbi:MAG: hypothetical protein NTZ04_05800 [Chloroflexi bacterium]|nr:hypothetical protein [Chloroflexota bacterium]
MSAQYLGAWLAKFQPKGTNVWRVNFRGYTDHYDHQGFGGWESLEMVQRYTRSVTVEDSLKVCKALVEQAFKRWDPIRST